MIDICFLNYGKLHLIRVFETSELNEAFTLIGRKFQQLSTYKVFN